MRVLSVLFVCLSLLSGEAKAVIEPAFLSVVKLFTAMSELDHSKMQEAVTDNFILLEDGEVWGISELIAVVNPSEYRRDNFFSLISSDIREDIALINYWNKGVFTSQKTSKEIIWLESVVVIKQGDNWRLQQMHSTQVDSNRVPASVEFVELH